LLIFIQENAMGVTTRANPPHPAGNSTAGSNKAANGAPRVVGMISGAASDVLHKVKPGFDRIAQITRQLTRSPMLPARHPTG